MAAKVNPASLLSLDDLFTTESERNTKKEDREEPRLGDREKAAQTGKEEPQDHASEQTVKKTFFLTQKNYDALKLHHMLYANSAREYSKIVNEALESYLADEIEALARAEKKAAGSKRFVLAMSQLSENLS